MDIKTPAALLIGAAVVGFAGDTLDVVEKAVGLFGQPNIKVNENYIVFDLGPNFLGEDDRVAALRREVGEIAEQIGGIRFALTSDIEELAKTNSKEIAETACELYKENLGETSVENCVEQAIISTFMATYTIENKSEMDLSNFEIEMQKYSAEVKFAGMFDRFVDNPRERGECLYIVEDDDDCFAKLSGPRYPLKLPQTIQKGERLVVPIYLAFEVSLNDGGSKGLRHVSGHMIVSPFVLPISVKIGSQTPIAKSRPMSPTPQITKGEYEIRG